MSLTLSIDAREIPEVRKRRIPNREEWLLWRETTIGASEVPSLFGEGYRSAFELFGIKTGIYQPEIPRAVIEENKMTLPPAEVGQWLEAPLFDLIRRMRPAWVVQPNPTPGGLHFTHQKHRASSTPDGFLYAEEEDGPGVTQIKTVAEMIFDKEWIVDGMLEPPIGVIVQTMMDAALSGCSWGYVGVLSRGQFNARFYLYRVAVKPALVTKAFALVDEFWDRVARNEPYEPNYARDGSVISALYGDADAPMIDLDGEKAERMAAILAEREGLKRVEKEGSEAEKSRRALDNEIVFTLGNASAGLMPDGRLVTAPVTNRRGYSVEPTSYRTVRIKAFQESRSSTRLWPRGV